MGNAPSAQPIKAKTNSTSPIADQLAEYREYALDPIKSILLDNRDDPGLKVTPSEYDPRFPNTDITKWCYVSFVDYYRCRKLRGEDYEPCNYFKNQYGNICPSPWIEMWESWRENGTFLANV